MGQRRDERNVARHISLACADSSSFVTVAAINNSAILSLWIIRVGLRARVVVAARPGRGGVPFNSVRFKGSLLRIRRACLFRGMRRSSPFEDMACDLVDHLERCRISFFSRSSVIVFVIASTSYLGNHRRRIIIFLFKRCTPSIFRVIKTKQEWKIKSGTNEKEQPEQATVRRGWKKIFAKALSSHLPAKLSRWSFYCVRIARATGENYCESTEHVDVNTARARLPHEPRG